MARPWETLSYRIEDRRGLSGNQPPPRVRTRPAVWPLNRPPSTQIRPLTIDVFDALRVLAGLLEGGFVYDLLGVEDDDVGVGPGPQDALVRQAQLSSGEGGHLPEPPPPG